MKPTDLPETVDIARRFGDEHEDRLVFLSHGAIDERAMMVTQSFACFSYDGSVNIISSTTNYPSCLPGSSETANHTYQQVNLDHEEMDKLAKAWLKWQVETPTGTESET